MKPEELKDNFDKLQNSIQNFKTEFDSAIQKGESTQHEVNAKFDKIIDEITERAEEHNGKIAALEAMSNQPVSAADEKEKNHAEFNKHFNSFARVDDKLDLSGYLKQHNGLSVDVNPQGGFLVLPTYATIEKNRFFETTPMRQLASVQTIGTDSLIIPLDDDEFDAGWVGERESRDLTDEADIAELEFKVHEMYAKPQATQKLLDDASVDIESWVSNHLFDKFNRLEATAFTTGNGSKKPMGILSYSAWASAGTYQRNAIEQINMGSASTVTADGLQDVQNGLFEPYQPNATWLMRRATFGTVAKLKDGEGNYLFNRNLDKGVGTAFDLLGSPVRFGADMPAIAANALAIAYGDFRRGYQIVDRIGMRMLRDPYTNKPYIQFYTTKRVGGGVKNFEAIKIGKVAA